MNGFSDPMFWRLTLVGLLGLVGYFAAQRANEANVSVKGGPLAILKDHWLSIASGGIGYFYCAITLWEGGEVPMLGYKIEATRSQGPYILAGAAAPVVFMIGYGIALPKLKRLAASKLGEGEKP